MEELDFVCLKMFSSLCCGKSTAEIRTLVVTTLQLQMDYLTSGVKPRLI
jgi:hypothetical protein